MAFTPKQQREHRKKLKAQGICTLCHKRKGDPLCKQCRELLNRNLKWYKKKWRKEGRCQKCGARGLKKGTLHCRKCSTISAEANERRRRRLRERGLCTRCGGPKDDPDLNWCVNCQENKTMSKIIHESFD